MQSPGLFVINLGTGLIAISGLINTIPNFCPIYEVVEVVAGGGC